VIPLPEETRNLEDVSFVNWDLGWAITNRKVYSTLNGGKTWTQRYVASWSLKSVSAVTPNQVWVAGLSEKLAATNDGGQSWEVQSLTNQSQSYFTKIVFFGATNGWLLGAQGAIFRYQREPSGWKDVSSLSTRGTSLYGIAFADSRRGWIVGDTSIFFSDDGGKRWTEQKRHVKDALLDVCALPNGQAWAVGAMGTVLRTVDHGENWVFRDLSWDFRNLIRR
jgi:photosystem II stability/assembly factor-like uncharacterized protein